MSNPPPADTNGSASRGCARTVIVLGLLLVLVAVGLAYKFGILTIKVAFAEDQTAILEEMRDRAVSADSSYEAARRLEYAVNYYPSGSKQDAGSRLDRMVERARRSAVREIIAHLRAKTGKDFGDDPQVWIARLTR